MSGSNSSYPAAGPETALPRSTQDEPLAMTVYDLSALGQRSAYDAAATRAGRWKMLALMLVCAAPVLASYFTYYVVRPDARKNYGELVEPQHLMPSGLVGTDLQGNTVPLETLKDQWLFISVADSACDPQCERHLFLQRQLRAGLGKDKERLDWVWLRTGDAALSEPLRQAAAQATVLHMKEADIARWLQPAAGQGLADHLYVVDPMGHWMMRFPANADPTRMRRDLERLLRASAGWDRAGR